MSKRILLIEDSEDIANMVKSYLSEKLYSVTLATDGEKGIELFNEDSKYDLILLDIMLPKKMDLKLWNKYEEKVQFP
ncbi:Response regulator receiver domain-containing protein [Anaerosphaera aminiphila DSM 21120]|uniref:Response regulator receiver domain-containing protein n=1 Tax=Anaerosphaera aminiphila DSM 21120 TaxID=1120995 RepID=A0A1M5PIR3_9FIRM|nr:Response regulator receiver domain-containing protein [Anaerosphaera aminiphila DSM 21120]